jgi:hypothetical protein
MRGRVSRRLSTIPDAHKGLNRGGLSWNLSLATKKVVGRVDPAASRSTLDRNPEGGAMKYLCFIRHSEKYRETPPPAALMEAMGKFVQKSMKDGTLVDTGGLLPSKDGVRLRLARGEITVTDGPFSESKEVIGGWAILNADSKADAIRISREFMELHRKHWPEFEGESEVRPMFDPGMGP